MLISFIVLAINSLEIENTTFNSIFIICISIVTFICGIFFGNKYSKHYIEKIYSRYKIIKSLYNQDSSSKNNSMDSLNNDENHTDSENSYSSENTGKDKVNDNNMSKSISEKSSDDSNDDYDESDDDESDADENEKIDNSNSYCIDIDNLLLRKKVENFTLIDNIS